MWILQDNMEQLAYMFLLFFILNIHQNIVSAYLQCCAPKVLICSEANASPTEGKTQTNINSV